MLTQRSQQPPSSRAHSLTVAECTTTGVGWLAVGLAACWLVFATPLVTLAVSLHSRSVASPLLGTAVWAVALTAPTCFIVIGISRLAGVASRLRRRAKPLRPVHAMAGRLPAGVVSLPTIRLPDGRQIPDVVLGSHGIAFFEPLPPPATTRRVDGRWEARLGDGSWRQIESPLDRAARDADSMRRFLAADDRDFIVKVHPAVMSSAPQVERTRTCAVVALADVPGWIAALPAQRSLSADRLQRLRLLLEGLAS
jgi:hypothetical protein